MSYSSELKTYLLGIENKKDCCDAAFRAGLKLMPFDGRGGVAFCEKDNGGAVFCEKDNGCYLRGVFIACGSMTDPDKQYYVSFTGEGVAAAGKALSACGITPLFGVKKSKPMVYLRESEAISDFLAAVGASKNALGLLEIGVINSMKREANRKNNADLANLDKTATASAEVRNAIAAIMRHKDYKKLPDPLKETARLRLENPSLTLDELRLLHSAPISKSGLYHRLKKLAELSLKYGR